MKFGERQTHAGETDEWSRRGIKGGGGESCERREKARGSRWKAEREEATPPWREKEGSSEGLKGREREEC